MPLKDDAKTMPHQRRAIDKALKNDGSILISHSMGLGKTYTSIAIANELKKRNKAGNVLAVVPASLRSNFADNGVKKYTKDKVAIFGSRAEGTHHIEDDVIPNSHYYVVSYDMFKKDPEMYINRTKADTLIVDEMHNFRNPDTKNYQQMRSVRGKVRNFIGLTGTPFNNHPYDIAPLIDIVSNGNHKLPMDKGSFSKKFLEHGPMYDMHGKVMNKYQEGEHLKNTDVLEKELGKWVHHATPSDLKGEDVPKKLVEDVDVEMSPLQIQHYNFVMQKVPWTVRNTIRKGLPVDRKEAFHILPMLTQARNVANGVHYMNKNITPAVSAEMTPKVKKALDDIHTHVRETPDAQVIIHSHMLEGGVDVVSAGLKTRGIPHAVFTGKVKDEDRQQAVKDYNAGKIKALIVSSAGTTGLNLPNTTMHVALDGHYNPAVTEQIEARGVRAGGLRHRDPEDRKVIVKRYRSVFPETWMTRMGFQKKDMAIDEWIYGIAKDKNDINAQAEDILKKTASLIDKLKADLAGEHDAINMYQRHIDTIKDPEIIKKLKEIRDEEKHHVGELQEMLAKKAAEVKAYHYSKDGKPPMNILNYSDEEQKRILKEMRKDGFSRGNDYIKIRKFVERALAQEAKDKLGDKVRVEHPLYFRIGKDKNNWGSAGSHVEYKVDPEALKYCTFTIGDSFDYLRRYQHQSGKKSLPEIIREGMVLKKDLSKMAPKDLTDANPNMKERKGGNYIEGQLWAPYKVYGNKIVLDK